jgi:glycosyltransferase involved in cell wall biosynthesis
MLKRLGAGAYHSPTFSSLIGAPCPWVLTVHDLNHLKYGGKSKRLYYERLLKPFARKAAALVTVSEFSRAELAGWVGLPPARIEIVSNVIAPQEKVPEAAVAEAVNAAGTKRGRYFLTLSNPKPHKNLGTLVAAYRAYRAAVPGGWDLLLSVRPGEVPGTECEGIRCIGGVADVSARALLAGAGTVAFPSSYEGFGLPPVEAAAQGIPVVVSRIAPHREGLQDLLQGEALWVEPMDVAAWTSALTRASSGKGELLAPSIESRAAILRRYSARQMGERMDLIYRRVLGIST